MQQGLTNYQQKKIRDNLEMIYNMATIRQVKDGKDWYPRAHQWCTEVAGQYRLDTHTVAGVVSSLSPNNRWDRNLIDAKAVINTWNAGLPMETVKVCTYNTNKAKAFRVLNGGVMRVFPMDKSPKTHAFVRNIAVLDPNRVTIDVWHWRASTLGMKSARPKTLTTKRYRQIEKITLDLAGRYDLRGYEFQAIVWNVIRESNSLNYEV
jgi:hypothetical protein